MDNILWIIDIDGTILNVHKNQIPAWCEALKRAYSIIPDEQTLVKYFGKPFKSVLKNVVTHYGISDQEFKTHYQLALKTYTHAVTSYLDKNGGDYLPGAVGFLKN